MISSMKLRITISISIGLTLVLTAVISTEPITQKAYTAVGSSSISGGSLGQSNGFGGASGGGTTVQSGPGGGVDRGGGGVDRHLFCDTGVETPICKQ